MNQKPVPLGLSKTAERVPFLKWTGGKRWLRSHIDSILPTRFNRYIEPFLGGGALFFHLRPWPASLSDINGELINAYQQVRDNVEEIIARLSQFNICPAFYAKLRATSARLPVTKAVRFLYLNRTAFNGIYRVNRDGDFNVPYGCKPGTILCDQALLRSASGALQNRQLLVADFAEAIRRAQPGDLVYADPPYTTKHNNNGFRRYNEIIFSWRDQERLAECCRQAVERGVHVIVSNANHRPVIRLYDGFCVKRVSRQSLISGDLNSRCEITEALIYHVTGRR
jgi:DNA adenine methylase